MAFFDKVQEGNLENKGKKKETPSDSSVIKETSDNSNSSVSSESPSLEHKPDIVDSDNKTGGKIDLPKSPMDEYEAQSAASIISDTRSSSQSSKDSLSGSLTQNTTAQKSDSISQINLSNVKEKNQETELEMGSRLNLLQDFKEGQPVETVLDSLIAIIKENNGKVALSKIRQQSDLGAKQINYYMNILEDGGIITIHYPLNPLSSAIVEIKTESVNPLELGDEKLGDDKKLIEKYTVISDYVVADVNIWTVPFENTPIYQVVPHKLSPGSQALIFNLIAEMARIIPVKLEEITDPRKMVELKNRFYEVAKDLLRKRLITVSDNILKVLTGVLLHQSYGLGDMEVIMSDNWLEEVAINGAAHPITVYHRKYGWLKTTKKFSSEQEIYNFASHIGRKVGKQINNLDPIMDAHMLTGDRVAATLFPISTEGDTMTIRRFSRNPWTVTHMLDPKNHTMSKEMMAFLWMCIQYELNLLVVGGTASGKTSVLNTLSSLVPPSNRVISIEDTREISLPEALHWNWVPLASRPKNAEGVGEVTMLDLMVASLRMRPDRIIVGEIRRKQQAEALFEAMHTGHSVSATMHADTAEQIKRRLTQPPIEIPEDEIQALHLVLVQYRDRRRGIRRSLEIAELLPGSNDSRVNMNYLYRWRPRRDVFEKDNESVRIYEDLNLHTGMTVNDIQNELAEKEMVLQWLIDNNIRDINKVGQIMRIYYKYPKLLLDTIEDKGNPKHLKG